MAISSRPDTAGEGARSPWDGQRMTMEEFLALPEEDPGLEFDDGVVTQKMSPTADHVELQAIFRQVFNETAEPQRLGRTFVELRFRIQHRAQIPDVGFYRRERLKTRDGRRYAPDQGLPDIAVEIVSPDQSVTSLILKCQQYLADGSQIALVVDPDDEAILVFRPGQPVRVLQGDDRIDVDDVLPGITLTVCQLFDMIVPRWVAEANTRSEESRDAEA